MQRRPQDYLNLDVKARWVFGLDLTVLLASAGYLLANFENLTRFGAGPLFAFLVSLSTSLWFAGQAITLQEYHGSGITPKNINIHEWTDFLTGGPTELRLFYATQILHLASVLVLNEAANEKKSRNLSRSITAALVSIPLALIAVAFAVLRSCFS